MALTKVHARMTAPTVNVDSYASVQDAINAVPSGGVLEFSPGKTYEPTSRLTVTTPMSIIAYGATIAFPDNRSSGGFNSDAMTITSSNVHIYGGTWTETAPDGTYPQIGTHGIVFLGTENGVGVAPTYIDNVSFQDATIHSWQNVAVSFVRCRNFCVESNYLHTIGYTGIQTRSSNNGIINDNIVRNIHPSGTAGDNAYGIAITLSGNGNTVRRPVSHTITVSGNLIENCLTWEGIDTHGGFAITVNGNTVKNCRTGIAMVAYIGGATSADDVGCSHCNVVGNTVYNDTSVIPLTSAQRGIVADGQVRSGGTNRGQQITITGNTLTNCGSKSSGDGIGAIDVLAVNGANITGNSLYDSGSNGITVYSCENLNVSGNTIFGINPNATTAFPEATATFSGNPTASDTLTLNGVVCTFSASASAVVSNTAITVNIGASLAATLTNLAAILIIARDTGTASIAPNGRLGFCNFTASSTVLTITYQFPTRMLSTNWGLAESSSVITLSGSNLSIPSDNQGSGIMIDQLSGGASPTGLIVGNMIRNPSASGMALRGINQKTDTSISYSDNVFLGKGVLYDIEGSAVLTAYRIDSLFENTVTYDLPSISAGSSFDINLPAPIGNNSANIFDISMDRYLDGLVITTQGAAGGYVIARITNTTASAIDIASTTIAYSVKKIKRDSYGDPTT
jgi:hypothetical protein